MSRATAQNLPLYSQWWEESGIGDRVREIADQAWTGRCARTGTNTDPDFGVLMRI